MRVHRRRELRAIQARVRAHPVRGLHDLGRVGRGGEHLRDELVRIQRDRRDELQHLFRRLHSEGGGRRRDVLLGAVDDGVLCMGAHREGDGDAKRSEALLRCVHLGSL